MLTPQASLTPLSEPPLPNPRISPLAGSFSAMGLIVAAGCWAAEAPPGWIAAAGFGAFGAAATPGVWTDRYELPVSLRWLSMSALSATLIAMGTVPGRYEPLLLAAVMVPGLESAATAIDRRALPLLPFTIICGWLAGRMLLGPMVGSDVALGLVMLAAVLANSAVITKLLPAPQAPEIVSDPDPLDQGTRALLDTACLASESGWFLIDMTDGQIHWSSQALRIVGGRRRDGRTPDIDDFAALHPRDVRGAVRDRLAQTRVDERRVRWTGALRTSPHDVRQVAWAVVPWNDGGESTRYVLGTLVDHTERLALEEAHRRTAAAMDALLSHAPVVMARMERSGVVTEFRGSGLARLGFNEHEALGLNPLSSKATSPVMHERLERALAGDLVEYKSVGEHDGEAWCFRTFLFPDEHRTGLIAVSIDTTEAYTAQRSLKHSEGRFDLAVRGSAVGIWELDFKTGSLYLSDRIASFAGMAPDDLSAESLRETYPEAWEQVVSAIRKHLETGEPFAPEVALARPDGRTIHLYLRGAASVSRTGDPVRMAGSVQDVTARHRAQERLRAEVRRAEAANASKTLFLANMSHELRTPMNAIVGMVELLNRSDLDSSQTECTDVINRASNDLLALIDDVLDLAKVEQGTLTLDVQDADLGIITTDVMARFRETARNKGIELSLEMPDDAPTMVKSDPLRFKQVLTNLIGNAVKFTDSGSVRVTVAAEPVDDAEVSTWRYVFKVRDTGVGIPPEALERIFDKFVQVDETMTRRRGGSGLGLAIVRSLVEGMGGTISAESMLGAGSTFTVRLELETFDKVEPSPAPETPQASQEPLSLRVLVAEDNPVNQRVIGRLLSVLGVEPVLVGDGMAAIEELEQHIYDLVLMDVQMPVLDGLSATRRWRRQEIEDGAGMHTPIVALTAHASETDRRMCEEAGMDGHLTKPVRLDVLRAELVKHVPDKPVAELPVTTAG